MCPPDFSTRLVDTTVNDGQPLELICKVTGDPEPQITWLKNGKVNIKLEIFIQNNKKTNIKCKMTKRYFEIFHSGENKYL